MAKWEWINVRPGILALSGTPIQIRREALKSSSGKVSVDPAYLIYEHDKFLTWAHTLAEAKNSAIREAKGLIEMGLCEDPSE